MAEQRKSPDPAAPPSGGEGGAPSASAALEEALREAEARIAELDARNLELEKLAAARGVKLSCANIALSRAKIAFDEAAARREAMVQEASHDLRTPLTSVKGAAQNLLDGIAGPLDPSAREYVEIMRDHADRLIGIVNWLVDAMSISADPVELSRTEVDLSALAEDVVRGLSPIANERGVTLTCEPHPAHGVVDVVRFRQVIENLVGNALKFTDRGGAVRVAVCENEHQVGVRVKDTGVGMSPEAANRVFDRYYRARSPRGGSGLGLAISRELVRLHGGDITLTTKLGEGTELTVTLPKEPPALTPEA